MGSFLGLWAALVGTFLAYLIYSALSKTFFHPLCHFPGPKLAALTRWYAAYYELIRDGDLVEHLHDLHEMYGPVVRISPDELHFSDPRAYASIYNSKFLKDPRFYQAFADGESSFASTNPREAKIHKDAVSPLFSRRAILKLESVVQDKVDLLISELLRYKSLDQSANIGSAFHSTTVDIITSYCFGHSYNTLAAQNFQHSIVVSMRDTLPLPFYFRYFPTMKLVVLCVSDWLSQNWFSMGFIDMRKELSSQIDTILVDPTVLQSAEHETIFDHLVTPPSVGDQHFLLDKNRLLNEATNLIFAGSDTVASTCKIGSFHVLNDRCVYARLMKELDEAWPDKDSKIGLEILERLPYLTAVVKESLRMAHGVVSGFTRIVGPDSAKIAGMDIPKSTVVSIGATFVHNNAEIFPDPFKFSPDRWLQPNSKDLDTYLVAFSKGPRSCLGINLAWCELYLIFANLFRMTEMVIDKTTVDDLKFRAYFLPVYRGRPFRVFVKDRLA